MRDFIKLLSVLFGLVAVSIFAACDRDSPTEEAGERIEEIGDNIEDAAD